MGAITLSKTNRLYWLGRYLERVYTALKTAEPIFEADIDGAEGDYASYCKAFGIPNIYTNTADFCHRFYFDEQNPNSILATLTYAYDNAVVLRETLTSETLAYIQLAVSAMEKAARDSAPGVALQWVRDDIMAFRGSCEEKLDDEAARNIIKTGASLERVDLYLRLGVDATRCKAEFSRLLNRLYKTALPADPEKLSFLVDALLDETAPPCSNRELLDALESLFTAV